MRRTTKGSLRTVRRAGVAAGLVGLAVTAVGCAAPDPAAAQALVDRLRAGAATVSTETVSMIVEIDGTTVSVTEGEVDLPGPGGAGGEPDHRARRPHGGPGVPHGRTGLLGQGRSAAGPGGVEAERVEVDTGHRLMHSLEPACDPDTWTQALAPAPAYRSVEEAGRTSVDDVPATHDEVELDAQVAGELSGQPDLAETLRDAVPVDLHVDDQGRVVRTEMELEVEGHDASMRTDVRDDGDEVDIRRTGPSQVGRVTR